MTDIPVVDLAPFRDGNPAARQRIAAQVAQACETLGFLVVSGHGVPAVDSSALHAEALRFFDRPLAEKMTVRRPRDDQNRGYIPYGEETLAKMHGGITPPDYKEVFAIGPDEIPNEPYFTGPLAYPDFAPNLWPENSAKLKQAMLTYYDGMLGLARLLADIYGHALGMPERFLSNACRATPASFDCCITRHRKANLHRVSCAVVPTRTWA